MQVRLELRYQGHMDLVVTIIAHVLNDSQYGKPGAWQPHVGPAQADLEGHLLTRRLRACPLLPPLPGPTPTPSTALPPGPHICRSYNIAFSPLALHLPLPFTPAEFIIYQLRPC